MEFNEKLQELRKSKSLTQEELAEVLCVSRAAVAKWESGRGLPSIDSIKDISEFFSVSIDDLLSGEKILSLAERESKIRIQSFCELLLGITDLFAVLLVVLPLYPNEINGFIYSVNLLNYSQTTDINLKIYWIIFLLLFIAGLVKIIMIKINWNKCIAAITDFSFIINIIIVLYLSLTRQVYAIIISFFILMIKAAVFIKKIKENNM